MLVPNICDPIVDSCIAMFWHTTAAPCLAESEIQIARVKPVGSVKEAQAAKLRAGKILKGIAADVPLSRFEAHGSFADAECSDSDCQGRQDREGVRPRWYIHLNIATQDSLSL